ncbi:DUF4214 domain-containing protein [Salipiger abyssi]|uniref:DUF4214 domain-containing protein n=1 Tax=Salipiger abyssi TaxID=1250539 RepID=UPI001A8EB401|nr:DUF4214 domain-containing protein [Salipiger abyssi]MBN9889838.1 DUF4214 domain-containing protein [Salipiger abyssi]
MSISLKGFSALAPSFRVNSGTDGSQTDPASVALAGGGSVSVWRSDRSDSADSALYGQIFDAAGAQVGSEFLITGGFENAQAPSVARLGDGGFAVAWKSNTDDSPFGAILVQRFGADGAAAGDPLEMSVPSDTVRAAPSLTSHDDGGLTVIWQSLGEDGSDSGLFGRHVDAGGTVSAAEVQINVTTSNAQTDPVVIDLQDGRQLVAWSSVSADGAASVIQGRFLDADGLPTGAELPLSPTGAGQRTEPDLAELSDGGIVAVWRGSASGAIFVRRFDDSGTQVGTDSIIQGRFTDEIRQVQAPQVAAVPSGGFFVVYHAKDEDTRSFEIFGQLFDQAGHKIGPARQINTFEDNIQDMPSVDIMADGNAVVSWQSNAQDGDEYGIYSQVLLLNQPTSGTVEITGTAEERQVLTAVAQLEDGNGLGTSAYRWYRDDQLVQDSASESYVLSQDDVGAVISVVVAHTDQEGFVDLIESAPTDQVANVDDPASGLPLLTGELRAGQFLYVDTSALEDTDGISEIAYSWTVGDTLVPGATKKSLILSEDYYGQTVTATVTATDASGTRTVFEVQSDGTVAETPRELLLSAETETELVYASEPDAVIRLDNDTAFAVFGSDTEMTVVALDLATGTEIARDTFSAGNDRIYETGHIGDTGYVLFADPDFQRTSRPAIKTFSLEDGEIVAEDIDLGFRAELESALHEIDLHEIGDGQLLVTGKGQAEIFDLSGDTPVMVDSFEFLDDPYTVSTQAISLTDDLYVFIAANSYWYSPIVSAEIRSLSSDLVLDIDLGAQFESRYGSSYDVSKIYLQEGEDGLLYVDIGVIDSAGFDYDVWRAVIDPDGPEVISATPTGVAYSEVVDPSPDYLDDSGLLADDALLRPEFVETESGAYRLVIRDYRLNAAPDGQPEIFGTPVQGGTLLADTSAITDDDGITGLQFAWWRDGIAIEGAESETYRLTQADVGHEITVAISYQDGESRIEHVLSDPSTPVANVNDAPTGDVFVYEAPSGALRSHILDLEDPDGLGELGELSFQWLRDGTPIAGATDGNYRPVAGDDGHEITVAVSFTDGGGTLERIDSIAVPTQVGTTESDALAGTTGSEAIVGLSGNDSLIGVSGADSLIGGNGNDLLAGEARPAAAAYGVAVTNQVFRLYQSALDRAPDAQGYAAWSERLAEGELTLLDVAERFVQSPQFSNQYGGYDDTEFVEQLYHNVLGRPSDPGGLARWTGELETGSSRAEVLLGFSQSPQFIANTDGEATAFALNASATDWADEVYRLYQVTLERAPDLKGFMNWSARLGTGMSFDDAIAGFVKSPEFQDTYGDVDNAGFVTLLYNNALGREPDAQGLARWTGELDRGTPKETVVRGFVQSPELIQNTEAALEDWVRAQGRDDVLDAGDGENVLFGGMLSDTFLFDASRGGTHKVMDLESWDNLRFYGFGYDRDADVRAHMTQVEEDVVFEDQGVTVTLIGIDMADITDDMIL